MNWKEIKNSSDNSYYIFNGVKLYDKLYIEALKFHEPGLAAVLDESGAYHIDINGEALYSERYSRTFGYYFNRAAVTNGKDCFHLDQFGKKVYQQSYPWCGNFQESVCVIRNWDNTYFHINLNGERLYEPRYLFAGDFKDGIACVKTEQGFMHIDRQGKNICNKIFNDLGVFHKNYATAKDEMGWFHIDKKGIDLYPQRYKQVEPFYNGHSVVDTFTGDKLVINEKGEEILTI